MNNKHLSLLSKSAADAVLANDVLTYLSNSGDLSIGVNSVVCIAAEKIHEVSDRLFKLIEEITGESVY